MSSRHLIILYLAVFPKDRIVTLNLNVSSCRIRKHYLNSVNNKKSSKIQLANNHTFVYKILFCKIDCTLKSYKIGRKTISFGSMLIASNFVHLAIIPLPVWQHYHIEWVQQFIKIISILCFIAAPNIKVRWQKYYH